MFYGNTLPNQHFAQEDDAFSMEKNPM